MTRARPVQVAHSVTGGATASASVNADAEVMPTATPAPAEPVHEGDDERRPVDAGSSIGTGQPNA